MDPEVRTARRQVLAFVVAVLAAATAYELTIVGDGGLDHASMAVTFGLMWLPLTVSAVLRAIWREHPRDVGWRFGPGLPLAYVVPALCAAATYAAAVLTGGVWFQPPPALAGADAPVTAWLIAVALDGTLAVVAGAVFAFGEELGWRGYLVPRLVRARVPAPLVLSGIVWGLFHVPLILQGGYASSELPWVSAALFMATVVPAAVFVGWLRLATGSVWPAVLAHAAHNVFFQNVFDGWFAGPLEPWLAGEGGAFACASYTAVALWLWRSGRLARALASPAG